jgi:hypothetical protein
MSPDPLARASSGASIASLSSSRGSTFPPSSRAGGLQRPRGFYFNGRAALSGLLGGVIDEGRGSFIRCPNLGLLLEKLAHAVIHVPPTRWRIALGIWLLTCTVPPPTPREGFPQVPSRGFYFAAARSTSTQARRLVQAWIDSGAECP